MTLFAADSPHVSGVRPSPNFNDRIGGPADAIVLHYTGMASGAAAIARLCDPAAEVSCHYVVETKGDILQLVPEDKRAWHAGRSFWRGDRDLNSRSIGVEIVNGGHQFGLPPYPARQIDAVIALCLDVMRRRGVSPARVLAHSDIAPDRKEDPGERFPWRRLALANVCLFTPPAPIRSDAALDDAQTIRLAQAALARLGFDVAPSGAMDQPTCDALRAFQRRCRPRRVDGRLDRSTLETLRRYDARLPAAAP